MDEPILKVRGGGRFGRHLFWSTNYTWPLVTYVFLPDRLKIAYPMGRLDLWPGDVPGLKPRPTIFFYTVPVEHQRRDLPRYLHLSVPKRQKVLDAFMQAGFSVTL